MCWFHLKVESCNSHTKAMVLWHRKLMCKFLKFCKSPTSTSVQMSFYWFFPFKNEFDYLSSVCTVILAKKRKNNLANSVL